jgi:hypothetical protein
MGVNEKLIWTESYESNDDFSAKQYYGCKFDANRRVVLPTADSDVMAGIVLNKPTDGKAAEVLVVGRAPGVVAEQITAGQRVRIASGGKVALWEVGDTTTQCVGQCVEGAAADGQVGVFNFNFASGIKTA